MFNWHNSEDGSAQVYKSLNSAYILVYNFLEYFTDGLMTDFTDFTDFTDDCSIRSILI